MAWAVPHTDVMLKVLGAPHQTELITSLFRLTQALLDLGATVQVWACGDATTLTRAGLGRRKPPDLTDRTREFPSTCALAFDLLAAHPHQLDWYACRFCCADRGSTDQIPEVRIRPPARFWEHAQATDQILVMGVC